MALAVLMGLGLSGIVGAETWWWDGGLIRLPVPIGGASGLPVPLLSWVGIAVYTACFNSLFGSRRIRLSAAVRLGFALHVLVLLAKQAVYMASVPPSVLAGWYLHYWQAVWAAALAGGAAGIMWGIRDWWRARPAEPGFFLPPLLGGYAVLWIISWRVAPGLVLWTTLAGVGFFWANRLPILRARWTHLVSLMGRERVFLMLVFLAALLLRLFYTARVMTNPDFLNTGSDGPTYDALAWAIVQGQPPPESVPWWATGKHFFAPGYVRFVAFMYGLVGRSYIAVCAVQALIGAAACVLMYAVAKRLFGSTVARIAAVFGAVNFLMVFAAAAIGHQALDLFWTLLVVWCLVCYTENPAHWGRWMPAVGVFLGLAAVTRETNLAFAAFLLAWFLLGVRVRVGWRRAALHVAMLSFGFCLVVLPFLQGTGGGIQKRLGLQWFYLQHSSTPINSWFNPWRDPAGAWALILEQPVTVLGRVGEAVVGNFNAMFLNQDYGSFDLVFLMRGSPYYLGMWWYAYCLAFVGLGLLLRQAWRMPVERLGWWLIAGLLISRTLVHLFFESAYRHRVPLEPYLIMLAAVGLTTLLRHTRMVAVKA